MAQPLEGIRVIELAGGIAGPYAGKLLADYGADVIKIEPPAGDRARTLGPFPDSGPDPEQSATFLHLNTNKRSVVADLSTPDGADLVRQLIPTADVVIESFPPGTLDGWGLGPEAMKAIKPPLVVTSVTPFGQTGPYAGYKGEEIVHYAIGGPMSATGLAHREPVKMGGAVGQYQCGTIATTATLAALAMAEASGEGTHIDVSNVDTQVGSIDRRMSYLLYRAYTDRNVPRSEGSTVGPLPGGVKPTLDGHVLISTMPAWLPRMFSVLEDPDLPALYQDPAFMLNEELPEIADTAVMIWALGRTNQDAMEEAQAAGWPVTVCNRPVDLLSDPHFTARNYFETVDHPVAGSIRHPGAPIRMAGGGWEIRRPAPMLGEHTVEVVAELDAASDGASASTTANAPETTPRSLPLEGVRIMDMTVVWAGPYSTTLLGDLGAEVIRVENPWIFPTVTRGVLPRPPEQLVPDLGGIFGGYPDLDVGQRPWNRVALFTAHGRNKKCATLDLRKESGKEMFLRMAEETDVLIENNSVDLLDKLGVGWDELHKRNPNLIMIRMPSVGLDGPYRDYLGFGVNFEALCGLGMLRGYPGIDPAETDPVFHMDAASGSAGAFATLMALRKREQTGVGELVELSQAENMLNHIGEFLIDADRTGVSHETLGNRHLTRAPQGCYPASGDDRWVVLSVGSDDEWQGLQEAMGNPTWAADQRFASEIGRQEHHDEIDEHLAAWTATLTGHQAFERCQQHGVPAGPVLYEEDAYSDPHLRDRAMFRENGSSELGTHEYPTHVWKWDGPDLAWNPIPLLGGDNEYVYKSVCGVGDDDYAALNADGHLSLDYLDPNGNPL